MRKWLIVLLCFCLSFVAVAYAEEKGNFNLSGSIATYATRNQFESTDLVPSPENQNYKHEEYGGDFLLNMSYHHNRVYVKVEGYAHVDNAENSEESTLSEGYGELLLGDNTFVFVGKKIQSFGQSYGLNPVNVFADPLLDRPDYLSSKGSNNHVGVDMIGLDWLSDGGNFLKILYAPQFEKSNSTAEEEIALVKYGGVIDDGSMEYGLYAFSGLRPGGGISASYGLGNGSILYSDLNMRQGSEKKNIVDITDNQLVFSENDSKRSYIYATIGWGHAYENGISINIEYTHDETGYNSKQWNTFIEAIDASHTSILSLGEINNALNHYTLRQNYGFMRIAKDGFMSSEVNVVVDLLHGFDDQSGGTQLRTEYLLNQITFGFLVNQRYGSDNSEFTLRPSRSLFSLYIMTKF